MKHGRALVLVAALLCGGTAWAWFALGHQKATDLALAALPGDVPEFFRAGGGLMDNVCRDPDTFTRPVAPPQLHDCEALQHYFDTELFAGEKLPPTRYEFLERCYRKKLQPSKVGLLPYVVVECTERLSVCFAEHRRRPDDKNIQAKCLVYAGLLAHYAQDLCQPLHTTVDYDGRARADGSSPHSGIHARVDALLWNPARKDEAPPTISPRALTTAGATAPPPAPIAPPSSTAPTGKLSATSTQDPQVQAHRRAEARRAQELFDAVMAEVQRSHALVDKIYSLERDLPADRLAPLPPNVADFARERLGRAAEFTASLFLTAWQDSRYVEFPAWQRGQSGD